MTWLGLLAGEMAALRLDYIDDDDGGEGGMRNKSQQKKFAFGILSIGIYSYHRDGGDDGLNDINETSLVIHDNWNLFMIVSSLSGSSTTQKSGNQ